MGSLIGLGELIIQLAKSRGGGAIGWLVVYSFFRFLHRMNPKILCSRKILYHVEITVTQACTLRCSHCASLNQYFKNPETFSKEQVCNDIDILFKEVKFVVMCRFLGGEPFINKGLATMLQHITKYKKKYGLLGITTNATVVPDDNLLLAMKEAKVCVRCSDYGENSQKLKELCDKLSEYNIPFEIHRTREWRETHKPVKPNAVDGNENWRRCYKYNNCRVVKRGKLYYCVFLSNGEDLGVFPYNSEHGVAITNDMWEYLSRKKPFPACAYCGGDGRVLEPAKEQAKAPLEYINY